MELDEGLLGPQAATLGKPAKRWLAFLADVDVVQAGVGAAVVPDEYYTVFGAVIDPELTIEAPRSLPKNSGRLRSRPGLIRACIVSSGLRLVQRPGYRGEKADEIRMDEVMHHQALTGVAPSTDTHELMDVR